MRPLKISLFAALCLGVFGCAATNLGATAPRAGNATVHNAFEVQGSTSLRASYSSRDPGDSEPRGPVVIDRGVPTPQPAREPVFATPVPQPPIPGPGTVPNPYALYN